MPTFDQIMAEATAREAEWARRAAAAHRYVVSAIPVDRDHDTVTPAEWRAASLIERQDFDQYWRDKGVAAFCCLSCGFPAGRVASCEACA